MMYQNLPYTKVWVKESFLKGSDQFVFGKDENMLEGYLVGVRATRYEPPLFEVYLPKYNACYDKVMQCAIFCRDSSPETEIHLTDIAWWDCLSDNIQIYVKAMLVNSPVSMQTRTKNTVRGNYLFTIDYRPPAINASVDYTEAIYWTEHKQKNFFFDDKTGVLCCGPNNKVRYEHTSLGTSNPERPPFKVFTEPYWFSHELEDPLGGTNEFDYLQQTSEES